MAPTVLIDTNVLLDDLLAREPHAEASRRVVELCRAGSFSGVIAAHSVSNMFYILRKAYTTSERRTLLLAICDMFPIIGIDSEKILAALKDENFPDFEDCLQEKCALERGADYIVTWNGKDFSSGSIPALTPPELLRILETKPQ